jgi:hypothetical protein
LYRAVQVDVVWVGKACGRVSVLRTWQPVRSIVFFFSFFLFLLQTQKGCHPNTTQPSINFHKKQQPINQKKHKNTARSCTVEQQKGRGTEKK